MTRFENDKLVVFFEAYAVRGYELVMPADRYLEIAGECKTLAEFRVKFLTECETRRKPKPVAIPATAGQ